MGFMLSSGFIMVTRMTEKVLDKASYRLREIDYYWSHDKRFLLMKYLARFIAVREQFGQHRQPISEVLKKYPAASQVDLMDSIESLVDTLFQDGYALGLKLPDRMVKAFQEYAFSHPCYGNRQRDSSPISVLPAWLQDCPNMPCRVASYIKDQETCTLIKQLAEDSQLLAIAEAYLGQTPLHHKSELIWSFPHQSSSANCYTHFFHSDINDYRNIKFFFYLTDVDETSGPHYYIRQSHKNRPLLSQL